MSQKSGTPKMSSERIVKDIRRATRKQYSAKEKIRIVLDGLRGEHSIAELCRREGIAESLYYTWSKEFLEAGKRRLGGDTALGHCGECHTPRNLLYGLSSGRKFAGAMIKGWKAYNITSDPAWCIGAWSDAQLADYLSSGHAEGRSSAAGPMGEAVENSLRFLSEDDIRAMTAYLKSVPAIHDSAGVAAVQTSYAQVHAAKAAGSAGSGQSLGLRVFEGACASCHSFDHERRRR
jgi:mono/diheme cytochrome c family protein